MEKITSNTIRVTCFCYAKEIPITSTYNEFLKLFMKSFNVNKSEIKGIKFTIHILYKESQSQIREFVYIIDSDSSFNEVFIGEYSFIQQFQSIDQLTALAEFPGSQIDRSKIDKSDPVNKFHHEGLKKKNSINNEKLEMINKLKKDISELEKKIKNEKNKNRILEMKKKEKENKEIYGHQNFNKKKGLDEINEIQEKNFNDNYIDEPSVMIPQDIDANKKKEKNMILNSVFINNQKEFLITKKLDNILKGENIEYKFTISKPNINEYWPKDILLFCIPDDSDIYFPHVKLNNNIYSKKYEKKGTTYYDIIVKILFKNMKKIAKGKIYSLRSKLISDSYQIISMDIGKLSIKIV